MSAEKYLLEAANGHDDECDGLTKLEMLNMLADELGYDLCKQEVAVTVDEDTLIAETLSRR